MLGRALRRRSRRTLRARTASFGRALARLDVVEEVEFDIVSRTRSSGHGPGETRIHSSRTFLWRAQLFAARRTFSCRRQTDRWMSRPAAVEASGSLVLNRYLPVRPLGTGGSGSVWLAREVETDREVALKIVPREGTAGSRAEREAAAAARLRHPRCLRAHALARDARPRLHRLRVRCRQDAARGDASGRARRRSHARGGRPGTRGPGARARPRDRSP